MNALDQSYEKCTIFISPCPFLAPWKRSRTGAGTWWLLISWRHNFYLLQRSDFVKNHSSFNIADIDRCTIAIICILVTACMTRDPLFQHASIVRNVSRSEVGSVDIESASFLPKDYFTIFEGYSKDVSMIKLTPKFRETVQSMQGPISYNLSHIPCSDGCTSSIKVRHLFE